MRHAARGLFVCVLGCAGLACARKTENLTPDKAAVSAPATPRQVQVMTVREVELPRRLVLAGTLAADDRAVVSIKVPGRLASISVDLGTPVKRGQAIAQVEATDYALRVEQARSALGQARAMLGLAPDASDDHVDLEQTSLVRQAKAALDQARLDLDRARTLSERNLVGRADLDLAQTNHVKAQTALDAAREEMRNRQALLAQRKAELALAQQQLADATLRSPMDGVVEQRTASAGEYMLTGAPVATVVRVDPLRLRAEVPERDAQLVSVDLPVVATVEDVAGTFAGKVARLSPSLNEQNRTLTLEAEIKNPGNLRPGSFARAELSLPGRDKVLAVPTSAIVTFAGIQKVIGVVDGKAVEHTITTGERSGELTAVREGLSVGDVIVLTPGNLQEGQPVTVVGS